MPLPYESKTWCVVAKSLNLRLLKIPCLQMCSHDSHEGHQVTPPGQQVKHVVCGSQENLSLNMLCLMFNMHLKPPSMIMDLWWSNVFFFCLRIQTLSDNFLLICRKWKYLQILSLLLVNVEFEVRSTLTVRASSYSRPCFETNFLACFAINWYRTSLSLG